MNEGTASPGLSGEIPVSPIEEGMDGGGLRAADAGAGVEEVAVVPDDAEDPDDVADAENEDVEQRNPAQKALLTDPTPREVDDHLLTGHAVFRSWCSACVRGRGRAAGHPSGSRQDEGAEPVPVLSWDYCFLSSRCRADDLAEDRNGESPVLVMHDARSKGIYAHLVPKKGTDYPGMEEVVKKVVTDINNLGYRRVVFRSDNEHSILAFLRVVKAAWTGDVVFETSAEGDPQSNGAAESAVNAVKGRVRTAKVALEERTGATVPDDHPLLTWMVPYSLATFRRYTLGRDGKTCYERLLGRRAATPLASFGESVWWMPLQPSGKKLSPLEARFQTGRFVGPVDGSNTAIVVTATGAVRARTIRRRPPAERWAGNILDDVQASELTPNLLNEGETRIGIRAPVFQDEVPNVPPMPQDPTERPLVRRARLTRDDFARYGLSAGCPGCEHIQSGLAGHVGHNERCRARLEALLVATTEGKQRLERAVDRFNMYAEGLAAKAEQEKAEQDAQENEQALKRRRFWTKSPDPAAPLATGAGGTAASSSSPAAGSTAPATSSSSPAAGSTAPATSSSSLAAGSTAPMDHDMRMAVRTDTESGPATSGTRPIEGGAIEQPAEKRPRTQPPGPVDGDTDMAQLLDIFALSSNSETRGAVCEVYSPPRVAPLAAEAGLTVGWSLDLTTTDEKGKAWDFDKAECRAKCRDLLTRTRPLLLIGSPMCTWFSTLQAMNKHHMDPNVWARERARALVHLTFVFELYEMQALAGRYFAHEHPASADSWREDPVESFVQRYPDTFSVVMDQCMFGLTTPGPGGEELPAKKPTRWLTNSGCIAERLKLRCDGSHAHQQLTGNRAAAAQRYPPALCRALVAGMRDQLEADLMRENADELSHVEPDGADLPYLDLLAAEEFDDRDWEAEDDVHGGPLDAGEVQKARRKEIEFLWKREVYGYSTEQEAREKTGKVPLSLKWIDTDKGHDTGTANYRSRLVCTEVRRKGTEPIFSATPPLETLRLLIAVAANSDMHKGRDPIRMSVADVSRAHFYAKATRDVYVKLPAEDPRAGEPGICGKLQKTMYGTLDAAMRWGEDYAELLVQNGFTRGRASPCHFYHPLMDVKVLVYGDDFLVVARDEGQKFTLDLLRSRYDLSRVTTMGARAGDCKELSFLNRRITLHDWGLQYEPDTRHVPSVLKSLGLEHANGVNTLCSGSRQLAGRANSSEARRAADWRSPAELLPKEEHDGDRELGAADKAMFMSVAAKLNYLAMDRVDLQFAVKELMRHMAAPTCSHLAGLKRVARYLVNTPRLACRFRWRSLGEHIDVFCDSNFAGCVTTRRSTVGGVAMWNGQFVKSWSKTMGVIAMSSGEAELAAVTRAAAEGLGLRAVLEDFGVRVKVHVKSDATAAIGMVHRLGLGRVRHLAVGDLWVQERVRTGDIRVSKWPGSHNPADQQTKYLPAPDIARHCDLSGWIVPGKET